MEKVQPLKALTWDSRLCEAAKFHSEDLGPKGMTGGLSSDGTKPSKRIAKYVPESKSIVEIYFACRKWNNDNAKRIVLAMLLDDAYYGNFNRAEKMYSSRYTHLGIYSGPHAKKENYTVFSYVRI